MTQRTKAELIRHYRKDYRRAAKGQKGIILQNLVVLTGYARKYLIHALNQDVEIPKKITRKRISIYEPIIGHLETLWAASNFLCGKRLSPFIGKLLDALKRHGEIEVSSEQESLLLRISAATIDRLLVGAKKGLLLRGRSTTKPGTLLKHNIAIRTANEWDDTRPGFFEIDLVAHCGDSARGEYINTLDITDVATGWTICVPFMGRSEKFCVEAISKAKRSIPFPMLGIDSDNGSEFINDHLRRYCQRNGLKFTRSRPYKKNDQCRIEQKNWDVVRKMVGYARYDNPQQLDLLEHIYGALAFYQNYFQPSQKLIQKQRVGAKVTRKHDTATTPYERLMAHPGVSPETKDRLQQTYLELNPCQLIRTINQLVGQLLDH
jgi:hypothetical protein